MSTSGSTTSAPIGSTHITISKSSSSTQLQVPAMTAAILGAVLGAALLISWVAIALLTYEWRREKRKRLKLESKALWRGEGIGAGTSTLAYPTLKADKDDSYKSSGGVTSDREDILNTSTSRASTAPSTVASGANVGLLGQQQVHFFSEEPETYNTNASTARPFSTLSNLSDPFASPLPPFTPPPLTTTTSPLTPVSESEPSLGMALGFPDEEEVEEEDDEGVVEREGEVTETEDGDDESFVTMETGRTETAMSMGSVFREEMDYEEPDGSEVTVMAA